jgi:hypothetical protein
MASSGTFLEFRLAAMAIPPVSSVQARSGVVPGRFFAALDKSAGL